jgi:AraC-like DNA-binding protein
MLFTLNSRGSDSPYVQEIWHARNGHAGSFVSTAKNYWEMVVTRRDDTAMLTIRGPETKTTPLDCDPDGEWLGIRFSPGVFAPNLPVRQLVDHAIHLPCSRGRSFWLQGIPWQTPEFENADVFVDRLVRDGFLVQDPLVNAALQGQTTNSSLRSLQRHFLDATGLTYSTYCQIERALRALSLLQNGHSIPDVVYEARYYDQPHLTRSLKRWLGQTPGQIVDANRRA